MTKYLDDRVVAEAIDFVKKWRWNDEELRIPMNGFGLELGHSIDVLLECVEYERKEA